MAGRPWPVERLRPCGTEAAYRRHRRNGEDCDECRSANAAAKRRRTGGQPRQPARCGTRGGYDRHLRLREPTCHACREAIATEARDKYRRKNGIPLDMPRRGAPGYPVQPCGTPAAYKRHRRHGETPCDACREANSAYQRARYAERTR